LIERYLTPQHMKQCEHGCPLPALASEVARAEKPVKASFEAVVRGFVSRLVGDSEAALTEERALAIVALCVGGLSLARSVEDRALAERILATCQELAQLGLNDHSDSSKRSVAPNTATDENSRRMPI
jgi:TetR/AcrR family transcriptional repressor of nem operon